MSTNLDLDDVVSGQPEAAKELDQLRAENASLKEAISLSEDSRLMDEYIKLERANARQAERIKELEDSVRFARGLASQHNAIIIAQAAVISMAKTALEAVMRWVPDDFVAAGIGSVIAEINALPEVAEKASE